MDDGTAEKAREREWGKYRETVMALDASNNLTGRGSVPSWHDWHASWGARDTEVDALVIAQRLLREQLAYENRTKGAAQKSMAEAQATIENLNARIKVAIAVEDSNLDTGFYVIVGKMIAILSAPSSTGGTR